MGSRIMHLAIGKRVSEMVPLEDFDAFILGSVAIDWVRDKELSHFYRGETDAYTRHINFEEFNDTYSTVNDDFKRGCYAHLIADDVWLQGMYLPWLRYLIKRQDNPVSYHEDFELLNAQIAKYYNLEALLDTVSVPEIDRDIYLPIEFGNLDKMVDQLYLDIRTEKQGELTVFNFNQILGYIETSAEKIAYYLKNL